MNNTATLDEVLRPMAIRAAWEKVRSNRGAAGEDSVTIAELDGCFDRYWPGIERSIRMGDYRPAPLRPVSIPKPNGGTRKLAIPSVIDRVIQQSVAAVLGARWEPMFPPCSFAYRPGTGAAQALDAVMNAAADIPEPVALRFDIEDFFDTVPHRLCKDALADTPCDAELARLAMAAVAAPLATPGGPVARGAGIPQGSPLSPLMANRVLMPFDSAMLGLSNGYIRYADDMVVLCSSESAASRLLTRAGAVLASLGLRPNEAKTTITRLEDATFLGCGFHHDGIRWVRKLPADTLDACRRYLLELAGDGHPPVRLHRFLQQWACYFLPTPEDRRRHADFLNAMLAEFGLAQADNTGFVAGDETRRATPPPGFQYDGAGRARHHGWSRAAWAGRFFLRRISFGLTFRRKGFLPVPSGFRVSFMGHRLYFRF